MNLRRIKHTLLRLSPQEKVIGLGSLTVIVAAFLPWYQQIDIFDETVVKSNGLSGDLGIIGFVIFLMSLLGLLFLIGDHLHIRLPQFGYKKEQIIFFLMGQSAFLTLLTVAIYLKRSLEYTQAELRFGVLVAFMGAFFAAFAAFALIQKNERQNTQEFFGYQPNSDETDQNQVEPSLSPANNSFQSTEDTVTDPVQQQIEQQPTAKEDEFSDSESVGKERQKSYPDQGSYFNREAGL